MLHVSHERSVELFKARKSLEQLENRYTKAIRASKDDTKYVDTFNLFETCGA